MKQQSKRPGRTAEEISRYLDEIPKFTKDKHTLDTLRKMLALLGDPQEGLSVVHVAGTNGKGSVCSFLSSIIRKSGASAAVFTSPHLTTVKERFVFDGKNVEDGLFVQAFETVKSRLDEFTEQGLGHPSYFEFLFLMFMVMVKEHPTDYVVLETGLGGRLDATNVIQSPVVTVITSISLDHMEYLGDTVEKIAGEKAGIIKASVPVVYDNTDPRASRVIEARAKEMGAPAWPVDGSSYSGLRLEDGHIKLFWEERELELPFSAEYQAINCLLAVRAARLLGLSIAAVTEGVRAASWPGRMEQIEPGVYLDGAHNEGGIRAFAEAARRIAAQAAEVHAEAAQTEAAQTEAAYAEAAQTGTAQTEAAQTDAAQTEAAQTDAAQTGTALTGAGRKILLFAVVSDKEYQGMADIICREFAPDVLVLTQIHYSRGLDIGKLEAAARAAWKRSDPEGEHDVRVVETVEDAFREVKREKRPEDTVFCAGSLYLIGEIKKCLGGEKNER